MSEKMREILFRGKREDNGKWIQGGYQHFCLENDIYVYIGVWGEEMRSVKPETVEQFTGLTDKNGKKIFEGDIVRSYDPDYPESQMDCGIGQVEFYAGLWYVSGEVHNSLYELSTICCKELEVIGNIHDNPELLKK